jgi:nitronate monooxygenase
MKPQFETGFTKMLGIEFPLLVAPMFLISNSSMVIAALEAGVTAAIPALNYRTDNALREAIREIRQQTDKPFGFNLIVNKSNPRYKKQLDTLCELRVDFIITSLGSPATVIKRCKPLGIKVFCDVVNLEYAKKVEALGADALIAVGREAGGHCGPWPNKVLVPKLVKHCKIPVIAAGGVGKGSHIKELLELGAVGVSVGTIFIASAEAPVSKEYKQALVDYGAKDIVLSSKLSGSPLTVINTPYVQHIGTKASFLERLMKKHRWMRKYIKMLIAYRGMKKVEKAAFAATYQTVWCAGPSIEYVNKIRPLKEIVEQLVDEFFKKT